MPPSTPALTPSSLSDQIQACRGRAREFLAAKQWEHARRALHEGLSLAPDHAEMIADLAHATMQLGEVDHSLELARQALAIEAASPVALWVLGHQLTTLEQYDEAWAVYEEAFAIHPDVVDFYVGAARLAKREENWTQAQSLLETALALDPENTGAATMLATLHSTTGRQQRATAINKNALSIAPNEETLHATRAIVAFRSGHPLRAREAAREAARLDPCPRNIELFQSFDPLTRPLGLPLYWASFLVRRVPGGLRSIAALTVLGFLWLWSQEMPAAATGVLLAFGAFVAMCAFGPGIMERWCRRFPAR